MPGRLAAMIYGLACYLVFTLSFAYLPAFVGDFPVPRTIDVGPASDLWPAVAIDIGLLALFGIQHSVMARRGFKRWWTRVIPAACERSTYVLLSSLVFVLLFWQWRPITFRIWHVEGWPALALMALSTCGWLIALLASFQIDHFALFGLRQAGAAPGDGAAFKTPILYRLVRHPLMLGILLGFWATPSMSVGHLLFAAVSTLYVLIGIWFEERDLVAQFGASYQSYRSQVPMLLPRLIPLKNQTAR